MCQAFGFKSACYVRVQLKVETLLNTAGHETEDWPRAVTLSANEENVSVRWTKLHMRCKVFGKHPIRMLLNAGGNYWLGLKMSHSSWASAYWSQKNKIYRKTAWGGRKQGWAIRILFINQLFVRNQDYVFGFSPIRTLASVVQNHFSPPKGYYLLVLQLVIV